MAAEYNYGQRIPESDRNAAYEKFPHHSDKKERYRDRVKEAHRRQERMIQNQREGMGYGREASRERHGPPHGYEREQRYEYGREPPQHEHGREPPRYEYGRELVPEHGREPEYRQPVDHPKERIEYREPGAYDDCGGYTPQSPGGYDRDDRDSEPPPPQPDRYERHEGYYAEEQWSLTRQDRPRRGPAAPQLRRQPGYDDFGAGNPRPRGSLYNPLPNASPRRRADYDDYPGGSPRALNHQPWLSRPGVCYGTPRTPRGPPQHGFGEHEIERRGRNNMDGWSPAPSPGGEQGRRGFSGHNRRARRDGRGRRMSTSSAMGFDMGRGKLRRGDGGQRLY